MFPSAQIAPVLVLQADSKCLSSTSNQGEYFDFIILISILSVYSLNISKFNFSNTTERQAENFGARERKIKELAGQIAFKQQELVGGQTFKQAQMEKEFEQARVGLERGFSLEEVKQKAIGDIEQQKYLSAYDAAKTLLNSTITAISGQGSYANNPDLRQVATPV
jgi:hypothetical protein